MFGLPIDPVVPAVDQQVRCQDDHTDVLHIEHVVARKRRQQKELRDRIEAHADHRSQQRAKPPSCNEQEQGDDEELGVLPQHVDHAEGQHDGDADECDEVHRLAVVPLHLGQVVDELPKTGEVAWFQSHVRCLLRVRLSVWVD